MDLTPRQGVDRFGPCRRRASAASRSRGSCAVPRERFGDREALVDGRRCRASRLPASSPTRCVGRRAPPSPPASSPATGRRSGRPTSTEWIVAALGVLGAGGVLVPLNTRFKGDEAAYVLRKSGARMLFTVTGFLDTDYVAMLRGSGEADLPRSSASSCSDGDAPDGTTPWADYLAAGDAVPRGRRRRADRRGRRSTTSPTSSSRRARPGARRVRCHPRPVAAGVRRRGPRSSGCARATATSS